ncbi:hypothetical protein [Noviherbaspirillum denitrificans]|uniref:Uncharacterized protein n=1 Tax=Noviherbaspirillum denitrificans TaxID=1968433 RepID=A0A254T6Z8_9BURK|nr:hypothetical protein [Noviherbaspirillum denitrificans]OWW18416.1 hypothetical protein AYR66_01030 [Noviherbaspirillum denitrificans]OWW19380.1 hypothetical protein AYR66_07515 [Noviherbaspirillum denitrificans]
MTVRAKFKVTSITRQEHWDKAKGEIQTVRLAPVTSGSEENAAFYAATPSGQIELATINGEAGKQFGLGQEFYVDFTPAQ